MTEDAADASLIGWSICLASFDMVDCMALDGPPTLRHALSLSWHVSLHPKHPPPWFAPLRGLPVPSSDEYNDVGWPMLSGSIHELIHLQPACRDFRHLSGTHRPPPSMCSQDLYLGRTHFAKIVGSNKPIDVSSTAVFPPQPYPSRMGRAWLMKKAGEPHVSSTKRAFLEIS